MAMNDEEYKHFLSALAAKHVRRTLSLEEQERLQIALRELTQVSRQVQDLREEFPEKRRDGSEVRDVAERIRNPRAIQELQEARADRISFPRAGRLQLLPALAFQMTPLPLGAVSSVSFVGLIFC